MSIRHPGIQLRPYVHNSAILAARTLAQALSNIVTANEPIMAQLWATYMKLPEDQVILMYDDSRTTETFLWLTDFGPG